MPQDVRRRGHAFRWGVTIVLAAVGLAIGMAAIVRVVRPRGCRTSLTDWDEIQTSAKGGRWPEVKPRLELWIADHPEHGESRVLLGKVELQAHHRDAGVELLRSVPETDPSWAQAEMALGLLAIQERHAADAEQSFRRVAERDAGEIEARRNLLYLFGLEMRPAESRRILWQIYRIREDPNVLVDLVLELLLEQEDVRGLAPELELLVAQTPDDPFLRHCAWGMAQLYQGNPRQARPHLEAAAQQLEHDPSGRFALAECLIMLGEPVVADVILGTVPSEPVDALRNGGCFEAGSRRAPIGQSLRSSRGSEPSP